MRRSLIIGRRGFTLIELLIITVIISLLVAIAIPKFSGARNKAYRAQIQTDLRTLVNAMEAYFDDYTAYATDVALLNFNQTPSVTIEIVDTNGNGWSAKGTHQNTNMACGIYIGGATPPSGIAIPNEGVIGCTN